MEALTLVNSLSALSGASELSNLFSLYERSKTKIGGIFAVIMALALRHMMHNSSSVVEKAYAMLISIVKFVAYKKLTIVSSDKTSLDHHLIQEWNYIDHLKDSSFPIHVNNLHPQEDEDEDGIYTATEISYQPYFHRDVVKFVRERAAKSLKLVMERPELKTRCTRPSTTISIKDKILSASDETWFPTKLFPSKNYVNIAKAIVSHLKVCNLTGTNSTLGMLIDGEPGLGKTRCGDYIATENILYEVIKIDMMCYLSYSFDKLMDLFYHKRVIHGPTLFLIDEVDKYIDFFIKREWEIEQKINSTNKDMMVPPIDEDQFIQNRRCDFLNSLLRVLEKDGLRHPCIVLFCSNNFDTIFQGVDRTHFHSLSSRFMRYTFTRCYKTELVEYFSYYNNIFINTDLYIEPATLESAVSNLKEDVSITFRSLNHISFRQQYNLLGVIRELNERVVDDSPPLTPRKEEVAIPIKVRETTKEIKADPEKKTLTTATIEETEKKESERNKLRKQTRTRKELEIVQERERANAEARLNSVEDKRELLRLYGEPKLEDFGDFEEEKEDDTPPMTSNKRTAIVVAEIKDHLDRIKEAKGKKNKTECTINMLNYMLGSDPIEFMKEHPVFKVTFEEKLVELESDSIEVASQLRPIRLKFEKAFSS